MNVTTRSQLEALLKELTENPNLLEDFEDILDVSEIEEDNYRRARLHLLGFVDAFAENGTINAKLAQDYYAIIGFSRTEANYFRQAGNKYEQ
jgi:hypothetical protein